MTAVSIRTTRYQCPHCKRTRSTRRAAEAHIARCFKNPEARGCKTCALFCPASSDETGRAGYAIDHPESCGAGVDIAIGLVVACPHWEAIW